MRTVTFYSYKGGVGRSLLVAWTARALARRGHDVLALDLDLEAPGLHHKLVPEGGSDSIERGFVDLLQAFQEGREPPESLGPFTVPVRAEPGETGSLRLMAAGAAPRPAYWRTLAALSWEELFFGADPAGVDFFAWLRGRLEVDLAPDFLLVDSRTGVTEMGGAALTLLADDVVALLAHNPESKEGVREVLRSIHRAPRPDRRPAPRMLAVVTRIPQELPADEEVRLRAGLRAYLEWPAEDLAATPELVDVLVVHGEPAVALDEAPILLPGSGLRLERDFDAVLARLLGEAPHDDLAAAPPPGLGQPTHGLEALRQNVALYRELAAEAPQRYESQLAVSLGNLASRLSDLGRTGEALAPMEEAVAIWRRLAARTPESFEPLLALSLHNIGNRLSELGRKHEALAATAEAVRRLLPAFERLPHAHAAQMRRLIGDLNALSREVGADPDAELLGRIRATLDGLEGT